MLASYSLQAELGDYDADRHSAQYIREFSLFPKVRQDVGQIREFSLFPKVRWTSVVVQC